MWMIVFGCLSFVAEIVKAAHTDLSRWLLPVSVYSGCAAAVMLLIIMRNRLFSIVPLARNIVVESMEEGILIVNEQGKVVDVNSNVNGLFRDPSGQGLLGRDARELLADWPQWRDACLGLNSGRLEIVSHEGEEVRTFIVKVYPLSDRKRLGTVSILIDITDKQRSIEQIARLNGVKDQLLTMVSHDIRDPLAVQINLIEELEIRQDQLDEDNREMVAALGEQIRHSYVMVENLLEWFRGQKEGIELRPECLELRGLVDEACQLMQLKGQNKGIRLDIGIPERLFVYADRETTLLVARNLISNAIKFSYRGGLVEITAQPQDGCVLVAVKDYGVGMEEELAQGLFDERRFASQAGTEGEKGTGLGLLVCHQFVRLSGGRMWADSSPGRGSTFYFTLSEC